MAHPEDPLGVEPIDRLVQDEDRRVAEEGGGDAETLAHAERELAGPTVRCFGEPDDPQDLVDPAAGDLVRIGEPVQVVAGPPAGVGGVGVEQCAHLVQGEAQ